MSTGLVVGASISLTVFIVTLALSTYGIGKEETNKEGAGYKTATVFTQVGATGVVIGMIFLIIAVLRLCSVNAVVGNSMNFQPNQ